MGEYAYRKEDNQYIKIGTCSNMYYIRYEDRFKVKQDDNSLDCSKCNNLIWRVPFPSEDHLKPGEYEDAFNRYLLGFVPFADEYKNAIWWLTGIINKDEKLRAVIKSNKFKHKTFECDFEEIINNVEDFELKERLLKYALM